MEVQNKRGFRPKIEGRPKEKKNTGWRAPLAVLKYLWVL